MQCRRGPAAPQPPPLRGRPKLCWFAFFHFIRLFFFNLKDRQSSDPLAHSPNAGNTCSWARLRPGPGTQCRPPTPCAIPCCLPGACISRKLEPRAGPGLEHRCVGRGHRGPNQHLLKLQAKCRLLAKVSTRPSLMRGKRLSGLLCSCSYARVWAAPCSLTCCVNSVLAPPL